MVDYSDYRQFQQLTVRKLIGEKDFASTTATTLWLRPKKQERLPSNKLGPYYSLWGQPRYHFILLYCFTHFILFYFILFYLILFCFILFYFIYCILLYFIGCCQFKKCYRTHIHTDSFVCRGAPQVKNSRCPNQR